MRYICIKTCHAPGPDGRRRVYLKGQRLDVEAEPGSSHLIPAYEAAVRGLSILSEQEKLEAVRARLSELGVSHSPSARLPRLLAMIEKAEAGEPAIKPQAV
ncbi:MAG: hypothetical protein ACOCVM_09355 [Desulfovibrionaceae bacterium]